MPDRLLRTDPSNGITIGKPIANTTVRFLDARHSLCRMIDITQGVGVDEARPFLGFAAQTSALPHTSISGGEGAA